MTSECDNNVYKSHPDIDTIDNHSRDVYAVAHIDIGRQGFEKIIYNEEQEREIDEISFSSCGSDLDLYDDYHEQYVSDDYPELDLDDEENVVAPDLDSTKQSVSEVLVDKSREERVFAPDAGDQDPMEDPGQSDIGQDHEEHVVEDVAGAARVDSSSVSIIH